MLSKMKLYWKEIFKFLSGVALAGSLADLQLYLNHISIPFVANISIPYFGSIFTWQEFGLRGLADFILFIVFFYYGFIKK